MGGVTYGHRCEREDEREDDPGKPYSSRETFWPKNTIIIYLKIHYTVLTVAGLAVLLTIVL